VFELLIALVVLGVVAYLVEQYLPMPAPFKVVVRVIIVIIAIVILLRFAGFIGGEWPKLR
jgi:uncharacterized membrane protein